MSGRHVLHDLGIRAKIPAGVEVAIFICYTALVAAIVGIAEHSVGRHMADHPAPWAVGLIALCTVSITALVLQLFDKVNDLHILHRINFKYYPAGGVDDADASARMYDAARVVINRAKDDGSCTILALNSFHEKFEPLDDLGSHQKYFAALDEKLGKVHYERFLQCASMEQLRANLGTAKEYREHFAHTIECRDRTANTEGTPRVRLDIVAPMFPTAFVIVKHDNGPADLIWQLNEYTGIMSGGRPQFRVRGLLIVADPDRRLIRYFEGWFNRLSRARAHRVEMSDLYDQGEGSPNTSPV
jgi:hypothetical protein